MDQRPLPIGIDNFRKIISGNYYYVDKTWMIKELLDQRAEVNLFTRPRRFGKTLNMSMLQYFFEDTKDMANPVDNHELFQGLRIMNAGRKYLDTMGTHPVISLSLKSAKQTTFSSALYKLREELWREFDRHSYVLNSLTGIKRKQYEAFLNQQASDDAYSGCLRFLSEILHAYHGFPTIILIDEYDVPLENAYFCGFYNDMAGFIRSLFESALKTNPSLEFSVITGCLRISKESIFTGLNNLNIISVLSNQYDEYYGFSQDEIDSLLTAYTLTEHAEIIKNWYDGYLFGENHVYNPWSVINYISDALAGGRTYPKPYWSNTSSNSIIKELIEHAAIEQRAEIEQLIEGLTIEKQIHEDITYDEIHFSEDNLWNFLFFTGYLKITGSRMKDDARYAALAIPNTEVKYIYRNTVLAWFDRAVQSWNLQPLYQALENGDTAAMEQILTEFLSETISFYDYAENYYHGFIAGLLKGNGKYIVKSNRENGLGRTDLLLRTPSIRGRAFVIEVKAASRYSEMENKCLEALEQIKEMMYCEELRAEGFKDIRAYGICFWKKEAMVRMI